ncbi:uncharacterized protein LOC132745503 [Ruditapes philippinarum]|uniref:uncharacterized protein LOC132745503 n=1 Tax=Ruditapes philippinarum TaxID=129788 RepID=UPI00295AA539|nr:uncharacterized protein LOC132745503 [Ruditapes philippinarum]
MEVIVIMYYLLMFTIEPAACLKIISQSGVAIEYAIEYESKCQPSAERFTIIIGISFVQCLQECGLRKHCGALNFWRKVSGCELFADSVDGDLNDWNCLHIFAKDIHIDKPCTHCVLGDVCDSVSATCRTKECPPDLLPSNSTHYGNMFSIGFTVRYLCNDGYMIIGGGVKETAICMDNGRWNASGCELVSCGEPSIQNANVVLDATNGTFYMDTATVTCEAWYQTRKNTITCQKSGKWESTICEDCYLTIPKEYTGKRNTTVTGMPCYRWDSPEAMEYNYTDLQYFPESTLSEAGNFCRNPDSRYFEPWCITTNQNAGYWEYCGIKKCK